MCLQRYCYLCLPERSGRSPRECSQERASGHHYLHVQFYVICERTITAGMWLHAQDVLGATGWPPNPELWLFRDLYSNFMHLDVGSITSRNRMDCKRAQFVSKAGLLPLPFLSLDYYTIYLQPRWDGASWIGIASIFSINNTQFMHYLFNRGSTIQLCSFKDDRKLNNRVFLPNHVSGRPFFWGKYIRTKLKTEQPHISAQ